MWSKTKYEGQSMAKSMNVAIVKTPARQRRNCCKKNTATNHARSLVNYWKWIKIIYSGSKSLAHAILLFDGKGCSKIRYEMWWPKQLPLLSACTKAWNSMWSCERLLERKMYRGKPMFSLYARVMKADWLMFLLSRSSPLHFEHVSDCLQRLSW